MDKQLETMPLPLRPSNFLEEEIKNDMQRMRQNGGGASATQANMIPNDPMREHFTLMSQPNMQGGDNKRSGLPQSLTKAKMHLAIIEIIPHILVSDGHNYIEAIFTKDAINDLRRSYGHIGLSKLRDKVILVTQCSLQVDSVDSSRNYNSFCNLTIRLVIEQFQPKMTESAPQKVLHQAKSIFKVQAI